MAITLYEYTKAVNIPKLENEINSSVDIITGLDSILLSGTDVLKIWMKAALPTGEQTALNALVTAHVNTADPNTAVSMVNIVGNTNLSSINLTYRMRPTIFSIPNSLGPHEFVVNWKYTCLILGAMVELTDNMIGDEMAYEMVPSTSIGPLVVAATSGDGFIYVAEAVFDSGITKGFKVKITTEEYEVLKAEKVNIGSVVTKLTLCSNLTASYAVNTECFVRFETVEKYKVMNTKDDLWVSRDTERAAYVPENTNMKFIYWNNSYATTGAKDVQVIFEMHL